LLLGAVVTLWPMCAGCQRHEEPFPAAGADHVRPDWGAVLPTEEQAKLPQYCAPAKPVNLSGQWTPDRPDIDRLERRLPSVIGRSLGRAILERGERLPRPSDYYRQYGGLYRDGRRIIYVCGLHRELIETMTEPHRWMHKAMGADDAGLWVLRVLYDVDADDFSPVQFEGRFSGTVRLRWF
jgi:hypothetical protein